MGSEKSKTGHILGWLQYGGLDQLHPWHLAGAVVCQGGEHMSRWQGHLAGAEVGTLQELALALSSLHSVCPHQPSSLTNSSTVELLG